ncbi:Serine/threonine-protein kinase Nek5, partial [Dissostichus eleginoides]
MLEHRTKLFGRSGKICGDTLQKSFLEWTYAKFEVKRLSQVQHFQCPSCTPSMLAVAVDGNRKLYRFKSQPGYMKTVQRITEATEDLEKLTAELSLQDDQVQQWVSDVQQWTTGTPIQNDLQKTIEGLYLSIKQRKFQLYRQSGGNKRRHKLRKKIVEEKKALEDAITEHNAVVGEADKLPPPNELLAEDNYSWKWECHVKQHWEYMRSVAGKIDHLSSQLSEGITGQSSTEALTERG